jgi:glutaminyl-tRNA synthetase
MLYQFERQEYFCIDSQEAKAGSLVFNRTVALKDSWGKIEKGGNDKVYCYHLYRI